MSTKLAVSILNNNGSKMLTYTAKCRIADPESTFPGASVEIVASTLYLEIYLPVHISHLVNCCG